MPCSKKSVEEIFLNDRLAACGALCAYGSSERCYAVAIFIVQRVRKLAVFIYHKHCRKVECGSGYKAITQREFIIKRGVYRIE